MSEQKNTVNIPTETKQETKQETTTPQETFPDYECIAKRKKDGRRCGNFCVYGSQYCGIHNRRNRSNEPGFNRCLRITSKGTVCIGEAEPGSSLCTRHRKLDERTRHSDFVNNANNATNNSTNNNTENKVDEKSQVEAELINRLFMAFGMYDNYDPNAMEIEFKIDSDVINNAINMNNNTRNKTKKSKKSVKPEITFNVLTRGERDCSICYEPKQMIIMHCCRQEMCAGCMKQITNNKCPFCKQENSMKFC